jgi:hypothetical protein
MRRSRRPVSLTVMKMEPLSRRTDVTLDLFQARPGLRRVPGAAGGRFLDAGGDPSHGEAGRGGGRGSAMDGTMHRTDGGEGLD